MNEPKDFTQEHEEWRGHLIDYIEARDLFPHGGKKKTRTTRQYTITNETCAAWDDFLYTYSGTRPSRGRGISSSMTEVAQLLLMAVITAFNTKEIVAKLKRIMPSEYAMKRIKENVKELYDLL